MPSSGILTLTDPDQHQAAVSRSENLSIVITGSGNFQSQIAFADLCDVAVDQGWMSLSRIIRGTPKQNTFRFHFPTFDNLVPAIFNGVETPLACMAFSNPGADFIARVPAGNRWGRISLPTETLISASHALSGYAIATPKAMDFLRPAPALMARLQNVHRATIQLAEKAPEILAHQEVARAIEQKLLHALIDCIADPEANKTTSSNRQQVMRRFHQVIEARQFEPLYLAEICAEIGVSARTLRHICVEYLGLGPHRYLWLRRMNLARRALTFADPTVTTVTKIANDLGFGELGRFAVAYRRVFGEPPSATLRRTPH
jgi:AraC-like DNA-binding protein